MAERPLLRLGNPEPIAARTIHGGGSKIIRPSRQQQRERLAPRFAHLENVVGDPQQLIALRADPASIAPERAIVFEVEGSVEDFYAQARNLGLEYLGDFEDEFQATEDFHKEKHPDDPLLGRIYLAMPDVLSLQQLLSRWQNYKTKKTMPRGQGDWGKLFAHLRDLRPWGPQDRVDDQSIDLWRRDLAANPGQAIRMEIELWFFENAERRAAAHQQIEALVGQAGGTVLHHAVIPEIRYDGALVTLPAAHVETLIADRNVALARDDDIMFLRPQTAVSHIRSDASGADNLEPATQVTWAGQEPIAALLDGLPIQNHRLLVSRLRVDDPEGLDATYQVAAREHGTTMASLIIHGDLNNNEPPIKRPLYVRPILQPTPGGGSERANSERLFIDVVHQAVRRIKEGDGGQPAAAPGVLVINFSIGDQSRPFARILSPMARLLDYLSYRYNVLFIVSAGNVLERLPVAAFQNLTEFENATPEQREKAILDALNANKAYRTLLSPAEAVNVLTVGGSHSGSAFTGQLPADRFDTFTAEDLPNIASAMGLGFRKVVKPEVLLPGGRTPVRFMQSNPLHLGAVTAGRNQFGLKAASPSPTGGTSYEDFACGSSVATALGTRAAHQIHDSLLDVDGGSNLAETDTEYLPLLLKVLLAHSAAWGSKGEFLDRTFGPQGTGSHNVRRDDIARLLGFGLPQVARVLDCAANQATMVGYGLISADEGLLYRIPLPEDLNGTLAFRSLTTTLAWFSPTNLRHQGYRRAALDISPGSDNKYWVAEDRYPYQPTDKAIGRGTLWHERRTAEQATVFFDDGELLLRVSCRAAAGELESPVPYALAVTFEVGIDAGISVYEQVRDALALQTRAPVTPAP